MTSVFVNIFLQVDTKTLVLFGNELVVEINFLESESNLFCDSMAFCLGRARPDLPETGGSYL